MRSIVLAILMFASAPPAEAAALRVAQTPVSQATIQMTPPPLAVPVAAAVPPTTPLPVVTMVTAAPTTTLVITTTPAPTTQAPAATTTIPLPTPPPPPPPLQAPVQLRSKGGNALPPVPAYPTALVGKLEKAGWTMIVGDSILMLQFLELANLIRPSCKKIQYEMLTREARNPIGFMFKEPPEYAMICKKNNLGCEFRRLRCHHFEFEAHCPLNGDPLCKMSRPRRCSMSEWESLVDDIKDPSTAFAVTFHWTTVTVGRVAPELDLFEQDPTPTEDNSRAVTERMRYANGKVGALVMDNCLHAYSTPMTAFNQTGFERRLALWKEVVTHNMDMFTDPKFGAYDGPIILQGCPKLMCSLAPDSATCKRHQDDLYRVDDALREVVKRHPSSSHIRFLDIREALENLPPGIAYADHMHPCWVRPCSWDPGCQEEIKAERNTTQKMYELAYSQYRVQNDAYATDILTFQEFKKVVETEVHTWMMRSSGNLSEPAHAPLGLPGKLVVKMGWAKGMLARLVIEQSALAKQWQSVASIQNFAPKPYDNNEGMCPNLLKTWIELVEKIPHGAGTAVASAATALAAAPEEPKPEASGGNASAGSEAFDDRKWAESPRWIMSEDDSAWLPANATEADDEWLTLSRRIDAEDPQRDVPPAPEGLPALRGGIWGQDSSITG